MDIWSVSFILFSSIRSNLIFVIPVNNQKAYLLKTTQYESFKKVRWPHGQILCATGTYHISKEWKLCIQYKSFIDIQGVPTAEQSMRWSWWEIDTVLCTGQQCWGWGTQTQAGIIQRDKCFHTSRSAAYALKAGKQSTLEYKLQERTLFSLEMCLQFMEQDLAHSSYPINICLQELKVQAPFCEQWVARESVGIVGGDVLGRIHGN